MPRRIFILRPDNLGDLVLFSGALRALRRHWPQAHLTLCVRAFAQNYFAHCPHLDRLVTYEDVDSVLLGSAGRLPGLPRFRGCDRLGTFLRKAAPAWIRRRYRSDLAILPLFAPFPIYHRIMRELPATERIGVCGTFLNQTPAEDLAARPGYSRQFDASVLPPNFPEIQATRKFLEFLDVDMTADDLWPEFWNTPADREKAARWLPAQPSQITLGLAPGVLSNPYKKLPAAWFVEAIQKFLQPSTRIVLLGSAADQPLCAEITQALRTHPAKIIDLSGQTTVRELIECLRRCTVVLSQDSAALHIATALRKPVVGILGGGHFGRFYPWGDPALARVVNHPMDCYGCNWHCIYPTVRCVQEIPPADAAHELQSLVAQLPAA